MGEINIWGRVVSFMSIGIVCVFIVNFFMFGSVFVRSRFSISYG